MNIIERTSKDGSKITFYFDFGRGPGQRPSTGIFIYTKPKDHIQKQFNKESLALLEVKKSERILDMQGAGTSFIPQHRIHQNFLTFYSDFVDKNKREGNRSLEGSLRKFIVFMKKDMRLKEADTLVVTASQITENQRERFRQYLLDTLNGETPGNYFMRYKKVIKAAKKAGYFKENPCEDIKAKTHPSAIKDTLTVDEFLTLIHAHCPNYEVKKAAVCSMYTGFRWCDVHELRWKQIKEDMIVLKKQSKTGVPLKIPLHPVVKAILGEPGNPDDLVFFLPTADGANKILKAWVRKSGIDKHITWHCLRHTVSDLLQSAGIDVETVSTFLGQTSAKYVLQTYKRRVKATHIQQAVDRLPAV